VVDVYDVVDVVILQNYFLARNQRLRAGCIEGIERRAEVCVHGLIAVTERHPVEAQPADAVFLLEDLDVADVVRGARLRQAGGARPLGVDTKDPISEISVCGSVTSSSSSSQDGIQNSTFGA
jgi:hypothetical protein